MTSVPMNVRALATAMCLGCLPACTPSTQDKDTEDTSATGSDSSGGAEVTESSTSPTESGATETDPTDSGDTEPADTDGPEVPAECLVPPPGVSAAFSIEGDWINDGKTLSPCTVDAVELEPGTIVTALACDFEGGAGAVTIRAAAAPEGPQTWKAGDMVQLRTSFLEDLDFWLIEMRGGDDALLLLALQGDALPPESLAPLTVEAGFPCGLEHEAGVPMTPFQLDFELEGVTRGLLQGERGFISLPESQAFAIDVEAANTNNCCHYTRWHKLLIRHVTRQ